MRSLTRWMVMLVVLCMLSATSPVAAAPELQAQPPVAVDVELIVEGLTAPLFLASPDDGSGRNFIVDQTGLIYILGADGELRSEPFLDLRDRSIDLLDSFDERGLLGLALHPAFAENGR